MTFATPLSIPLAIGVTGHRAIAESSVEKLESAVDRLLGEIRSKAPATPLLLLSGLAEGADRLVARLAMERHQADLVAVLPMAAEHYRQDFTDERSCAEFDRLLRQARMVVMAPSAYEGNEPPSREMRHIGYDSVGRWIALNSHLLIALWDGQEQRGQGGTAEVVEAKLRGRHPLVLDALQYDEGGAVAHIATPRASQKPASDTGEVKWRFPDANRIASKGERQCYDAIISRFDLVNRLLRSRAKARPTPKASVEGYVESLKDMASHYARRFQYRVHALVRCLAFAALCAAIATAASETIGTSEATVMSAVVVATGFGLWLYSFWRAWDKLHAEFRALAEACRIQTVWRAAGLGDCVADSYHPAQAASVDWIRRLMRTAFLLDGSHLQISDQPAQHAAQAAAARQWIDGQVEYFSGSKGVTRQYRRQARHFAVLGIICLVLGVLALGSGEALDVMHLDFPQFHSALVVNVGKALLAATAAVEAYQAFMAFEDLERSFAISAHLFSIGSAEARAAAEAGDEARLENLVRELGRAALVENVSWLETRRQRRIKPPGV